MVQQLEREFTGLLRPGKRHKVWHEPCQGIRINITGPFTELRIYDGTKLIYKAYSDEEFAEPLICLTGLNLEIDGPETVEYTMLCLPYKDAW